jgi:hypothetical protein
MVLGFVFLHSFWNFSCDDSTFTLLLEIDKEFPELFNTPTDMGFLPSPWRTLSIWLLYRRYG